MTFEIVDVIPDTPEWEAERRNSLGASEVAAVLGLSPWDTPLSIYKAKKGIARDFDEVLGYIGHASEPIIQGWVEQYSPQAGVKLEPAFMARSVEYPWLHASFDRVSHDSRGNLVTWQFKTAHHYAGHHWDEGVPTDIRVQLQSEILVAGSDGEWCVVWIGGREFRLFWEDRDQDFIDNYIIPDTKTFWYGNVEAEIAPEPTTAAEINAEYPSEAGSVIDGSELVLEAAERRAVLLSDIKAQQAEADALTVVIGQYMGTAETLTVGERRVLTYKTQNGKRSVPIADAEREAPHLIKQGAPFKVMRHVKEKP